MSESNAQCPVCTRRVSQRDGHFVTHGVVGYGAPCAGSKTEVKEEA